MYRRRRNHREKILFSFDSFLDVVANVNGIIIRLILVAWVGARTYHSSMTFLSEPAAEEPIHVKAPSPPRREDEPAAKEIERQRKELAELREQLAKRALAADDVGDAAKTLEAQLVSLSQLRETLLKETEVLAKETKKSTDATQSTAFSLEELAKRGKALRDAIAKVEAIAPPKKELRYHTPVSKTVTTDEIFFECKFGRVTYLDLPGLMREIEDGLREKEELLRDRYSVDDVTRPSGAFRLRYSIVRRKNQAEALGEAMQPRERVYFAYGLGKFIVEPIAPVRGETLAQAMKASSDFRQTVDSLDSQTVVTFWVYPDSFALFRSLRDYLSEKGIEVAARPLPETEPISGSPTGSRSRGQ